MVVASDLLLAATTAVCNYAYSLTEAATLDVRTILHKQLDDAITTHETMERVFCCVTGVPREHVR